MRQALGVLLFPLFFRLLKNLLLKSWVKNKNPWPSTRKEKEFRMTEANRKRKAGRWHFNRKVTKWTPSPQVWHPKLKKKTKNGNRFALFLFWLLCFLYRIARTGVKNNQTFYFLPSHPLVRHYFSWSYDVSRSSQTECGWTRTHTYRSQMKRSHTANCMSVVWHSNQTSRSIPFLSPPFFFILV